MSCEKDNPLSFSRQDHSNDQYSNRPLRPLVLGEKKANPYALKNMEQARINLQKKKKHIQIGKLTASHLYIKFMPRNEKEFQKLKKDSTLILYPFPLDYEIIDLGDGHQNPDVSSLEPSFYWYGALPIDQSIPKDIDFEILEKLFIPDEENGLSKRLEGIASQHDFAALVNEAYRITGHFKDTITSKRSSWRPAGRIRVWDNTLSQWKGVEGVKVRARRWFTTYRGIADANGYFQCNGTFKRPANYSIDWERYHFALQEGWLKGATINGPKKTGKWSLDLKGGKQAYYAHIFRAAYHYYYKPIKGLERPPKNNFWQTQMKIRAYEEFGSNDNAFGTHKKERRFLGAQIKIHTYGKADRTYATVIHELAHAAHWNLRRGKHYDQTELRIRESWARGVEWVLTREVYPKYTIHAKKPEYTLIVKDLIDSDNRFGNTHSPGEAVSHYSLQQIEATLKQTTSWEKWKANLKNNYVNDSKDHLSTLFDYWEK